MDPRANYYIFYRGATRLRHATNFNLINTRMRRKYRLRGSYYGSIVGLEGCDKLSGEEASKVFVEEDPHRAKVFSCH